MRRGIRHTIEQLAIAALLTLTLASPASAQESEDIFARVAELRARGLDLPAARLLTAERERSPSPRLSAELGLAYLGAGRAVDGERHLAAALEAEDDAWIDEHRAGLELALRYARASLAWVLVTCDAPGAEVRVLSTEQPAAPCGERQRIGVGEQFVEVRAWDRRSVREGVIAGPGETVEVRATLAPIECRPGTMHMGGEDGGCCWPDQAWVDGACAGVPECPDGGWSRGNECFSDEHPPPGPPRLATFRVSLLGGAAAFGRTDNSLFRHRLGAQGAGLSIGPRAELRVGFELVDRFGLELALGGTMQEAARWLDCPSGACAERATTAYTLDGGVLFVAHTDPPRAGGNLDFHLGIGVRPYVGVFFEHAAGGGSLAATVVPAELGLALFLTDFLSIDVLGQAELWIPWEYCGHGPDGAGYCMGFDSLDVELAWSALGGVTFHAE